MLTPNKLKKERIGGVIQNMTFKKYREHHIKRQGKAVPMKHRTENSGNAEIQAGFETKVS